MSKIDDKIINNVNIDEIMPVEPEETKCAPTITFENGSCIPLDLLIKMADAYNKYNNNEIIKLQPRLDALYPEQYKIYLLSELKKVSEGDQRNWINNKYIELLSDDDKERLEYKIFRPNGPQGKFDWLSTLDINQVLFQYQDKYPDFKFLGAVPIDFMELDYLPFKTLDLSKLENDGISKIGVIFNTDKSYQRGKHWISLYSDFKNGYVYFSDSVGSRPPKEVVNFMDILEKYIISTKNIPVDVRYNKTVHQKGFSECGVYSINFILRLLKGKTFDHISKKRLSDSRVNKCRIKYFGKTNQ